MKGNLVLEGRFFYDLGSVWERCGMRWGGARGVYFGRRSM